MFVCMCLHARTCPHGEEGMFGGYITAGKVSRSGFLSVDYTFNEVASNQDLHRIKERVNIWTSSLFCSCTL